MRLSRQRMSVGKRAATSEWLTTMSRRVDKNEHFSFYKFTACTSTLKSINLPHSSRLISNANNFAFECVLVSQYCVASALRHRCVIFVSPTNLTSYSSLSNLSLKSIAVVFGSLTKARVEFVLLELRIQTAERIVLALETSRTFFAWSYDYPLHALVVESH